MPRHLTEDQYDVSSVGTRLVNLAFPGSLFTVTSYNTEGLPYVQWSGGLSPDGYGKQPFIPSCAWTAYAFPDIVRLPLGL
jgi:hypothetical protein